MVSNFALFEFFLLSLARKFNYWKIKLIHIWNEQPIEIKIIWALTIFFLFFFILFFFILIYSRIYKNYTEKKKERIIQAFQEPLSKYLFNDDTDQISKEDRKAIRQEFGKHILGRKFNRKIILSEIIDLRNSYTGDIADKLKQLFLILGLDKEVKNKLKSRKWHVISNGINDATKMNLNQFSDTIIKLINHKNKIIRSEAQVAYVYLNQKDPFLFFENLKYQLSNWDQIKIHSVLMLYDVSKIPPMGKWLNSENESVVIFSLKMIGIFNHGGELENVTKCLEKQNENIKIEAIKTMGKLHSHESTLALLNCLSINKDNKVILIEILKSLEMIGIFDSDIEKIIDFMHSEDYDTVFQTSLAIKSAKNGSKLLEEKKHLFTEKNISIMNYALSFKN